MKVGRVFRHCVSMLAAGRIVLEGVAEAGAQSAKPNIVVIFGDDIGSVVS